MMRYSIYLSPNPLGTHVNLPMEYLGRVEQCEKTKDSYHALGRGGGGGGDDDDDGSGEREEPEKVKKKLCTGCGWVPDF